MIHAAKLGRVVRVRDPSGHVTLVGRLTDDPQLRSLPDGRSVCNLRPAVNDERDQPALFIDVARFGTGADACAQYPGTGREVALTGRLAYCEWQAGDGSKCSKHASSASR
jgi:single-strand DNA-binding protein